MALSLPDKASPLIALVLLNFALSAVAQPAKGRSRPPAAPKSAVSQRELGDGILFDGLQQIYRESDRHFEKGEFNHSINLCRVVVQGDPDNVEAYSSSAWLLWSTDRNDEAIALLKQGLNANRDTYYMYDELGMHYSLRLKQYSDAIPCFEQATRFECPFTTWHSLAHCYEKTGQWQKALAAWKRAASYPGDRVALTNLHRVEATIAKQAGAPSPQGSN